MSFNISATGAANLALQFTGLLGSDSTAGVIDLLHLQMQLLQNIGSKLDTIKQELDVIVASLLSLDTKVEALPARTAASIYKVDLQGRMFDIDELIDAYRDESQTGTRASISRLVEFIGRSYVEFRSARNRLFYLFPETPQDEDMLVIPIAALCMHYELICLTVTDQPESLRRVTRERYAAYFTKWLTGSGRGEEILATTLAAQRAVTASIKAEVHHSVCIAKTPYPEEPGIPRYSSYTARLQRYVRVMHLDDNDPDVRAAQALVARGMLATEDLIATATIEAVGAVKVLTFDIADGWESPKQKATLDAPVTLDDGSALELTVRGLIHAPDCAVTPESTTPQLPDLTAVLTERNARCRYLICLASLVAIGRDSLASLATGAPPGTILDPGSPFGADMRYLLDLLGQRAQAWQRLLTVASEKESVERKSVLASISTDWSALQAEAAQITAEYAAVEQRVRDNANPDVIRAAGLLLKPLAQAAQGALASIEAAHRRVVHDIAWNLGKAIDDTGAELGRAVVNIEVAAAATFDFIEAENSNLFKTLDRAAKAIRQGKIVDAIWATTIGRAELTQDALADAVLQSSLLKEIAMSAASIYGGPAGTAAFTAWYTYQATGGDLQAALRAGIIAGLSSAGMGISKDIPYTELTRRTLATAAVGAAAVAAAGGNEQDIIRGFLTGTALTLAGAYYASQVGRDMDGSVATKPAIDKFDPENQKLYGMFVDENGDPVIFLDEKNGSFYTKIDTNGIDGRITQVGIAATDAMGPVERALFAESAIPMQALGYGIPMMNSMAIFHDRMCDVLGLENAGLVAVTIIPAAILTVSASEVPLDNLIVETLNASNAPKLKRDENGFLVIEHLVVA